MDARVGTVPVCFAAARVVTINNFLGNCIKAVGQIGDGHSNSLTTSISSTAATGSIRQQCLHYLSLDEAF